MPVILHCQCPPPDHERQREFPIEVDKIREFSAEISGEACRRVFGTEIKAAHFYESLHEEVSSFYRPPLRRFFLRPAIEPILFYNREEIRGARLSINSCSVLVSLASGHPIVLHEGDQASERNARGNFASYPCVQYARGYLDRILQNSAQFHCPLSKAMYVFAEVILSHPYRDANGRLARALMLSSLAVDIGADFLDLPFGVVSTVYCDRYIMALQSLSATSNWNYYFDEMLDLLTISLENAWKFLGPRAG